MAKPQDPNFPIDMRNWSKDQANKQFNSKQLEFINADLENLRVIGIPGGGKTTVILEYIKNKTLKSDEFLVLTFSRKACDDFIEKGKNEQKDLFGSNNIKTFHSLSWKIVQNYGRTASVETCVVYAFNIIKKIIHEESKQQTLVTNELDEMKQQNESTIMSEKKLIINRDTTLMKQYKFLTLLKVIIIDEAQDVSENQYNLIMLISNYLNIPVIMVGDPNQNIYQFRNGSDKFLINHPGREIYFTHNYRSTHEIIQFINNIRPWKNYPDMISGIKKKGHKPNIYKMNIDKIKDEIIKLLKNNTYPLEDIAIISSCKKSKEINVNNSYINIGLSIIENLLSVNEIKFVSYNNDMDDETKINNSNSSKQANHVNLMTAHASKGLEFKQVIIVNFHFNTYGLRPTEEEYNIYKYLWYVACSRAMESLHIFAEQGKQIFPISKEAINKCNLFNISNNNNDDNLKFNEDGGFKNSVKLNVVSILSSFNEEQLYELENLLQLNSENTKVTEELLPFIVPHHNKEFPHHDEEFHQKGTGHVPEDLAKTSRGSGHSILLGLYMEEIFNYYLDKNIIKRRIIEHNNTIVIPKQLNKEFKKLQEYLGDIDLGIIPARLNIIKNKSSDIKKLINYIEYEIISRKIKKDDMFFLTIESDLRYTNYKYVNKILMSLLKINSNSLETKELNIGLCKERNTVLERKREKFKLESHKLIKDKYKTKEEDVLIMKYVLFDYQIKYEKKYWLMDPEIINLVKLYEKQINGIKLYANDLTEEFKKKCVLQKMLVHNNLNIVGIPDVINDGLIIDIKYVNRISTIHKMQVYLYGMIYNSCNQQLSSLSFDSNQNLNIACSSQNLAGTCSRQNSAGTCSRRIGELWNFKTGINHIIEFSSSINKMEVMKFLCKELKIKSKNNVFIYDLETTGLDIKEAKIIECCIYDYYCKQIYFNEIIKINTYIPTVITNLTGITNDMNRRGVDITQLRKKMTELFDFCYEPIFIAHNGDRFDLPIMKAHNLFPENDMYRTIDSLKLIANMYNEYNLYKDCKSLIKMYEKITNKKCNNAHRALADVMMISEIFECLNLTMDNFVTNS
jgi:superfamily I DNA/RNA helicase/DNA polymerase III epsilon subunit-like protein